MCVVTDVSSDVEAGGVCVCVCVCVCVVTDMSSGVEEEHSCRVAWDLWVSVDPWNFPGKNPGVGCHFLL